MSQLTAPEGQSHHGGKHTVAGAGSGPDFASGRRKQKENCKGTTRGHAH